MLLGSSAIHSKGKPFMRRAPRHMHRIVTLFILLGLFMAPNIGLFGGNALAASPAQELPPADIAVDEGGADVVTGEWNYSSYAIASHFLEPVVALMNYGPQLLGGGGSVPRSEQFLGLLTSPIAPSPSTFRVNVPKLPTGAAVDVDNDGEEDTGVQIYLLILGTNMIGDSYLEQVEQGGYASALFNPLSGALTEGTLLVYAPDDAQGFPSSAGEDGLILTADDPTVALPAGYTLVNINSDGEVTFDRASEAVMNTLEPASEASPDFSDQGILESFNSLIDVLTKRYSYTELRGLDWEEIRQTYLPQVEAADAADSLPDYFIALNDMALSIRDAHVEVTATDTQIRLGPIVKITEMTRGTLGAGVVELSDGRIVVNFLDPAGPGAEAGWVFGTEIISVDGVPISERVDSLPFVSPESTAEGIRLAQIRFALAFPAGTETTVEYKLPGSDEIESVTLTAGEDFATTPPFTEERAEISFKALDGGFGYIQWGAFNDPTYKLAVWEKFLTTFNQAPGIVIDLRDNGGGNVALFETMVSYFFTPNSPAQLHWIDYYVYDEESDGLVLEYAVDSELVSPNPSLTFNGGVVVLVNENSASAAEYFPQFLQHQGRALVVGEHGTDGAGGIIERASLPGSITFQFTKGRTVFAGTQELNLEAKGVTLDVRVPVTLEGEQAKLDGGDPVLDAALVALSEEAVRRSSGQITANPWQWTAGYNSGAQVVPVENPAAYTITFGEDGAVAIQADCNQAQGEYILADGAITITLGPATMAACPDGGQGEQFLQLLAAAVSVEMQNGQMIIVLAPENELLALVLAPVE